MIEQKQSAHWFRSLPFVLIASLLFPPLGLALLLTHREADASLKTLGSVLIVALGGLYFYLLLGSGSGPNTASHYDALERHRAEQRSSAPPIENQLQPENAQAQAPLESVVQQQASAVEAQAVAPGEAAPTVGSDSPSSQPQPSQSKRRRNYWTDFRGPGRAGRYDELTVKTAWPAEGLPLLWRQPVGGGYSSFTIADGVAYTIEQRRAQEVVAAYQMDTGRELWTHSWKGYFRESLGGDGPRSTPTWDAGRLYALGAEGELRCLDAKSGRPLWSKNILSDNGASNIHWGMAASPLIVDDKVIVQPGGSRSRSVVAYNKMTGAPVWKSLDDQASYTSPMLVTLAGARQILVVTARRVVGLDPASGALLWEHPWANSASINVSQPLIAGPNRFFISAGYGKGASLIEVKREGRGFVASSVWQNNSMKNKFNSSVLHEGHVYGLDEGILTCIDVATGERRWKGGRYGYGQVVATGGHLIVTTEDGEIVLVRATPKGHEELARFPALEGRTWNNPAISDGRLLVRNATQMACYKLTD